MKLLAVDQGSQHLGLAFFDADRVVWTKRISATSGWTWRRRMRFITDRVRGLLVDENVPDVIAIEDVVAGRFMRGLQTMSETRGWLMCVFDHWYPDVRQYAIHPSTVRAAVEAGRGRAKAIERYHVVAAHVLGGATVTEDEAAAVCIGLAARARLEREERLEAAGVGNAKGEGKVAMI